MSNEVAARILVVDDNPATLYSTSRVLRGTGWEVAEARNGAEALAQAVRGIDLIILDVNLPDIDGFEVSRRLRAGSDTARIPILQLSASLTRDADKLHGLEMGADGYMTHPVEPPSLVAAVRAFLRTSRAEAARHESDLKFKAIFDSAACGLALLSQSGMFLDANPAMCAILQLPRERIVTLSVADFVPETRHELVRSFAGAGPAAAPSKRAFTIRRADGSVVHTEWEVSGHSIPGLLLAVVTDVTDRLQLERDREQILTSERIARGDAERANRIKDDFLATLSHELRTPLNAIVGWSQLLNRTVQEKSPLKEGLEAIERSARAQAQLIADLLDVSSITTGKLRLDMQNMDLQSVIEAALAAISPAADAKSIRIVNVIDPHVGVVSGDPGRLQQVFWNLLSNAVKFTPRDGTIRLHLRRVESNIEVEIADTGCGIEPSLLPHIFDPFRQGDASTTRSHGGLGLGLAIVKRLLELHGGTIRAESPGSGKGATFTLALPVLAVQPGGLGIGREPVGRTVTLSSVRVMVVDDDADACMLMRRVLGDVGASVETANRVQEALDRIETFQPNVLVSDIGMPEKDGYALIREIRSRGLGHNRLPAVALTALARVEDRRRALLAGYQLHIAKPVDPAELIAAIATLLGMTGREDVD